MGGDFLLVLILVLHHCSDVAFGQNNCNSCYSKESCKNVSSKQCGSDSGSVCHSTYLLTNTASLYIRGCWHDDLLWLTNNYTKDCVDGCFRLNDDDGLASASYACVSCCTGNLCNNHAFFKIDGGGQCPTDGPTCRNCDDRNLIVDIEPEKGKKRDSSGSGSGSGLGVPDSSILSILNLQFKSFDKLCDCVCTSQEDPNQRLYPYGEKQGDTALRRYLDGVSDPITIDIEFPFFNKIYKTAYVGTNGIVSLGKPFYFWWPHYFPGYGWIRRRSVIAPFWVDVDIRQDGNVWYQVYTDPGDSVLWKASQDVQRHMEGFSNFEAMWVLVATWDRVPNYPDGCTAYGWWSWWLWWCYEDEYTGLRNTFQAVLVTDGLNSFVIYNYNADDLEWSGRWAKAVIGYNVEQGSFYVNNKLSETDEVKKIGQLASASNIGKAGKIMYQVSLHPSFQNQAKRNCRVWYNADKRKHDLRWVETLEPCPCRWWQAWRDRRFWFDWYSFCAYSIFESSSGSRQECCYSDDWFAWGSLVVGAPNGGAAERYHPDVDRERNYEWDEKPYEDCCGISKLCHLYYERRPSDDCSAYDPPRWAWFWGDPHISTLDGQQYTFNGWGEYIIMKTVNETFVLQGRTQPLPKSTATVFSAFSMAEFPSSNNSGFQSVSPESDVVHVQLTLDNFLVVKYQSVASANQSSWSDLTANFTELDNTTSITLHKVFITRPSNNTLVASFPSGISVTVEALKGLLAVVFAAPTKLQGETRGLLGVWDGNKDNDFVFQNGSLLQGNVTDRQIHEFGQSWQITESESLFYYQTDENASVFSHPYHEPVFPDEIPLSNFTQEQITACGGDSSCLYDYLQTNDPEIAMQTKGTNEANTAISQNLANNPPKLSGNSTFRLHVNKTASFTFTAFDPNDTYTVTLMGSPPPPEDYTFSRNGNHFNFTWTPSNLSAIRLVFIANDSSNAVSALHPEIRLCACPLDLNATCIDSDDDGGEDRFVLQDCKCGSGWEGQYCDEDIDGCEEINCFEGVECFDYPPPLDGAECGPCPDGTTTVADKCIDVNECNGTANGGCAQKCVNELYSFHCECHVGYRLEADNTSCSDVDECAEGNPCHQLCNNTAGSFFCDCVDGFKLDASDNRTCKPMLNCSGTHQCQEACAKIHGKSVCYCNSGYRLVDKFNCSDINECSEGIDNCDHLCSNKVGSFSCSCRDGYRLSLDGHSCQDVNECIGLSLPCNISGQICVNSLGSYSCLCPPGTVQLNNTCHVPFLPTDTPTRSASSRSGTPSAQSVGPSAGTPISVSTDGRLVSSGTPTSGTPTSGTPTNGTPTSGRVDTKSALPLGTLAGVALGAAALLLVLLTILIIIWCNFKKRYSKVIPLNNVKGQPSRSRAGQPQGIELVQYARHGARAELTEVSN